MRSGAKPTDHTLERSTKDEALSRLGSQIRARRKRQGLTLVELARKSGLSQPFLSQIERATAVPSMRSLTQIAEALGTTGPALLALPSEPAVSLVRADSAVEVEFIGGTARLVANGERALLPMEFRNGPTDFTDFYQHGGDEFMYVIAGEVEFELEGTANVTLRSRDCLYYDPTVRHRWRTVGTDAPWFIVVSNQPH
jgi:transcriptional regulator with XRE-family HTH domain